MNAAVVIFEDFSSISLDTLAKHVNQLPFPIKVFPVLVKGHKIEKRWIYTEDTNNAPSFMEKEEPIESLKSFIKSLKKDPCIVFINMNSTEYLDKFYAVLDKNKKSMSVHQSGVLIHTEELTDIYKHICKYIFSFSNWAAIKLTGIRLKSSNGKRKSLETEVYLQKVDYLLPSELSLCAQVEVNESEWVSMGESHLVTLQSKPLTKILQSTQLCFTNADTYLFLQASSSKTTEIHAQVLRRIKYASLTDFVHPSIQVTHLHRYIRHLLSKYKECPPLSNLLHPFLTPVYGSEYSASKYTPALKESISQVNGLPYKQKQTLLDALRELLETVKGDLCVKHQEILNLLSECYQKEVNTSSGYRHPGFPLIPPAGVPSLYTFLRSNLSG